LPGDGLVVSQPEECAIFIFHITRDATTEVELRQVYETADFAASDPTGEIRKQEQKLRDRIDSRRA
jgi:hypothetical protein